MTLEKVALVTGANKGIGFAISQQLAKKGYKVLMGARNVKRGEDAVGELIAQGLDVEFVLLDVSKEESIRKAAQDVHRRYKRLDVLVNNAGILIDNEIVPLEVTADVLRETLETNTIGVFLVAQAFLPLMKENGYGRIVNVSSWWGSIGLTTRGDTLQNPGFAYRLSKTALNVVTVQLAHDVKGYNILVNSCCPGWVKTDMGGEEATLTAEEGTDTPVWLATLPDKGPTGGFFSERKAIPW